ncbi:hypothetical protein HK405_008153 [Cladochytrium tenue]|nr:hypothetical protein HK405_008153 [Cladochytrium tenue]
MPRTKFDELLDRPKGGLRFNPAQTFALHVTWVVASPSAADSMLARGFTPCAAATQRDTPTTAVYLFRVSRNQRAAEAMRARVRSVADHPHYAPALRQLRMGIARAAVDGKLRLGGIDPAPLDLVLANGGGDCAVDDAAAVAAGLQFDPLVLECTELYLDRRAFYEHAASREWMRASPEILRPAYSLEACTFCVGAPSDDVWDRALEGHLRAVRFDRDGDLAPAAAAAVAAMRPGVWFVRGSGEGAAAAPSAPAGGVPLQPLPAWGFLEASVAAETGKWPALRRSIDALQAELAARVLLVVPTFSPADYDDDGNAPVARLPSARVMMSFVLDGEAPALAAVRSSSDEWVDARILAFGSGGVEAARALLERSGLGGSGALPNDIEVVDGDAARTQGALAGYPIHPLFQSLIEDEQFDYQE